MTTNSVENFEEIPEYYLEVGKPINLILNSTEFKTLTPNEFIEQYSNTIRNDSKIKDENDFAFALFCLSYWLVDIPPKIILDYIDDNIDNDYSKYIDLFPTYHDIILKRLSLKAHLKIGHSNTSMFSYMY